jgi:predicted O-methyltransferase YrrM
MNMKATILTDELYDYIVKHTPDAHPILKKLKEETLSLSDANMQIAPDQGAFMKMLIKLSSAQRVIEIGCFTGYSAISMASGLPLNGKLITLDHNPETSEMAKTFFKEAGFGNMIEHRLGDALVSLEQIADDYGHGNFDLIFIDADKERLNDYYEHALRLLRAGGLIVVDNVLWGGRVVDPTDETFSTAAIRQFCESVSQDNRVDKVMLHVADGLYLLQKLELN